MVDYRELRQIPNLLSLSRIPLGFLAAGFLSRNDSTSTVIAAMLLIAAGITDGLDGYVARRMGRAGSLGVALDPVADKVLAITLTISLILFREFPIWLAAAIIGRDLLIMAAGLLLARGRDLSLSSNMLGKWTFAALAVLLGAYVIRFEFSITLMTPIVVGLLVASLISYGRVFMAVQKGRQPRPVIDRRLYKVSRYSLLMVVAIAHAIMFYREFLQ